MDKNIPETQAVPYNRLLVTDDNVRTVSATKAADKQLIAGIRAKGILQNLIVRPAKKKGWFEVVAGGRRFAALGLLIKEGVYPKDCPVNCQIRSESESIELSLMENLQRAAMHPADEFDAFYKLAQEGLSERDIAEHFGVAVKHVKQRLKLAGVAPQLIAQYRKNKMALDDMMAFTVTDDHEKQLACWKDISRSHFGPHSIRRWLTDTAETTRSPVVKFVTVAAYKKAGGPTSLDLFESETYLSNRGLLLELAEKKLQQSAQKLDQEGWKWVTVSHDGEQATNGFIQLRPVAVNVPKKLEAEIQALTATLQAIEEEYETDDWTQEREDRFEAADEALDKAHAKQAEYNQFRDEDKAQAGCIVTYGHTGDLLVIRGLLRKEDARKVKPAPGAAAGEDTANTAQTVPQALTDDLTAYRQQIVKAAMADDAAVASDVLLYTLCAQAINKPGWCSDRLLDARVDAVKGSTALNDLDAMEASQVLAKRRNALNTAWLAIEDTAARFSALRALSAKEKKALLAYCVAETLTVSLSDNNGASGAGEQMVNDLGIDFHAHWRPTADNYFKRLRIPTLLALGGDWFGDAWVEKHAKAKKSALVEKHDAFFNGEAAGIEGEQLDIRTTWLPEGFIPNPSVEIA